MKSLNPINSVNARLLKYQSELKSTQESLKSLREDHGKLIKENITLENNNEQFKEAVENMCYGCVEKETSACLGCALNDVAITFGLW